MSDISLGIIVGLVVVGLAALAALAVGLFFGERGRRKDLMWLMGERARPAEAEMRAEVEPSMEGSSEANARRRAEISAVSDGLREELRAAGRPIDEDEIAMEALGLIAQMQTEVPEGMG